MPTGIITSNNFSMITLSTHGTMQTEQGTYIIKTPFGDNIINPAVAFMNDDAP